MMNQQLSTTEHAAYIRATLKAQYGWNSRQVSVNARYYSMGSSIDVRIKDASVPLKVVTAIAEKAERIDRDQFGDILSGGNRFVHVGYDGGLLNVMGTQWLGAVDAAFLELSTCSDNALIPITGTDVMLGYENNGRGLSVWHSDKGHLQSCYDLAGVAEYVAVRMVKGGN